VMRGGLMSCRPRGVGFTGSLWVSFIVACSSMMGLQRRWLPPLAAQNSNLQSQQIGHATRRTNSMSTAWLRHSSHDARLLRVAPRQPSSRLWESATDLRWRGRFLFVNSMARHTRGRAAVSPALCGVRSRSAVDASDRRRSRRAAQARRRAIRLGKPSIALCELP
jgi:hypothetical protein